MPPRAKKKGAYFDVREAIPKPGGYADEVTLGKIIGRIFLESLDTRSITTALENEALLNVSRGDDVEIFIDNHIEVTIDQRPVLYLYLRPTAKVPSMMDL